jgi:hypothetical protein
MDEGRNVKAQLICSLCSKVFDKREFACEMLRVTLTRVCRFDVQETWILLPVATCWSEDYTRWVVQVLCSGKDKV